MRNTYLYGFATFGHPNDYRQSPFKFDKERTAKNIKIFDLSNAIKIFPNTTLYAIRKENIDGVLGVSYAIYTFANEMHSLRDGTFIGSSILFTNEIPEENITISKLNQFHSLLVNNNTNNDVLQVKHSNDFELDPKLSREFFNDFEKIIYQFKPIAEIDNLDTTNSHIVVGSRTDDNTLTNNFKKALLLLNKFDTIFFTTSRDIVNYCISRNIYITTDEKGFEQEIADLQYKKEQIILGTVSEFEGEKQKLQSDKENVISDLKNQLERSRRTHLENERVLRESESSIDKINSFYSEFSIKLDDYSNQLKSGKKLDEVRTLYNENKRIFIDCVSNSKQPQFLKNIYKVKATPSLQVDYKHEKNHSFNQSDYSVGEDQVYRKYNWYKIFSFILAILLILSIVYFLWFYEQRNLKDKTKKEQSAVPKEKIIPQTKKTIQAELFPPPNSKLNENDLRLISKEKIKNKTLQEIVDIIFINNPTDIASYYKNQKEGYGKVLVSQNSTCFQNNICICDSLINIPSNNK